MIHGPAKQGLYDPRNEHDACGVGFVADIKGRRSHQIVRNALEVLLNLEHRGASGCDVNSGDGAGILMQTPHEFLQKECSFELPDFGQYAVGMVFLPVDERQQCEAIFARVVEEEGQRILGWRDVPTNDALLGPTARESKPIVRQVFIARKDLDEDAAFERKLYVIRRRASREVKQSNIDGFYISSLSYKTVVYKGMLTASQLPQFYPDLVDTSLTSALAIVHSRFSTNTFPSWARAHPYRYIAHNGEINTLRGNVNWMHARESRFASRLFGDDLQKVLPVIDNDASDSGMFDNALEMFLLAGRSLPHALMMMVPEPWTGDPFISHEKRAFYEYHSLISEPWDGPAAIVFSDGFTVGAMLDRNGLRPARYYVTKDDLVVLASEVGVLDIPAERIASKGSLKPGNLFLVDTKHGRIIGDDELKQSLAREHPYQEWLDANMITLDHLPTPPYVHTTNTETILRRQRVFGYTYEELRLLLEPMATTGSEPLGSMGADTPLAILSERPQLLYSYFKQLFAQVTNPPVDAIREELVMSADTCVGPEVNMLEPSPACARQIRLSSPILTNEELEKLRLFGDSDSHWGRAGFKSLTIPIVYSAAKGGKGLETALDDICTQSSASIDGEYDLIILSDRNLDEEMAPIPALLAVGAVHHHLIREGTRTHVGLIVESGEPREVHHFALLLGYGAAAINPYLVFETLHDNIRKELLSEIDEQTAVHNYVHAINKGIIKVISKMGISTTQGYCGAQIFEAIGLAQDVVDKYFTWTPSRIGGANLEVIAEEVRRRHTAAFVEESPVLESGGHYQYRKDGEPHLFNPLTVHKLQAACRTGNYATFKEYSELVNSRSRNLCTLRGVMEFRSSRSPVSIEEVEPVEAIVRRFKTGAMSYGSISKEAHESLAIAMNRIGGKSNTGEGGEDPERFGDSRNSAIKQVASGRFGVTSHYLVNAQELQIKIAQGAKPGEGGQLPGEKVYPWIATVRHSTPGVGLISPPPHHDIYSIEDLAQLIYDLKNANPEARISVKLVAESGVGTIAAGVAKARADVVLISGYDGGTGAAPLTSIKHAGAPWELGLAETHQTLLLNNLRSRITIETDGQLKTGRDVVVAALLGAEEFGFATAPLVTLGCIMMRACHLNTCPVGVATQDPKLRAKFTGDPSHVVNFMMFIAQEVRELMAQLGFRNVNEMVGHSECLEMAHVEHWKARHLDLSQVLFKPDVPATVGRYCQTKQHHDLENTLDHKVLLDLCQPALREGKPVSVTLPIHNVHRAVGTTLGSEVTRQYGPAGLPHDTIQLRFEGSAGQSFGAFIPKGITLRLEGDANDYLGKGLSGGKIVVAPPKESTFVPEENVIIGNVAFYGATSGEAYINGIAGQRFCVRNSGASVVVEAVGDHGCEYMTGGRVVVLGQVGRNFAAGMSGGVAYLVDDNKQFCNLEMVSLTTLKDHTEIELVKDMIFRHAEQTDSRRATEILLGWDQFVRKIVRVLPNDYARALEVWTQSEPSAVADG
ncbi:MAG TPA: glutamate synthase large subunit [Pyrinomonadaceae bacterium]|nr:glutamate synthase large subunit [Pyrinomonadaceae bacterium]